MKNWFTIDKIDDSTFIISEYRHPEETHCYLLIGSERCLLIDTGLGIGNIYEQVRKLTDKHVLAVATHILEQWADWELAYISSAVNMLGGGKFENKTLSLTKDAVTSIGGIKCLPGMGNTK